MADDIRRYTKGFGPCARFRPLTQRPSQAMRKPTSKTNLLVVVDLFTKWMEAFVLKAVPISKSCSSTNSSGRSIQSLLTSPANTDRQWCPVRVTRITNGKRQIKPGKQKCGPLSHITSECHFKAYIE